MDEKSVIVIDKKVLPDFKEGGVEEYTAALILCMLAVLEHWKGRGANGGNCSARRGWKSEKSRPIRSIAGKRAGLDNGL